MARAIPQHNAALPTLLLLELPDAALALLPRGSCCVPPFIVEEMEKNWCETDQSRHPHFDTHHLDTHSLIVAERG